MALDWLGERYPEASLSMTTLLLISRRKPFQDRPFLPIFSPRLLPHLHICILVIVVIIFIGFTWFIARVSVTFVISPFSGGAHWIILPPLAEVSRGCIDWTRLCCFLLIVLRAEYSSRRTRFSASSCDIFPALFSKYLERYSILPFKAWTSEVSTHWGFSFPSCVHLINLSYISARWARNSVSPMMAEGCSLCSLFIIASSSGYPFLASNC